MAEHQHHVDTDLPPEVIWEFVREMDHWAPFLTGYQSHEKQSDTESTWTLKGDVGVLARTLRFRVLITEWAGPERVTFALKGMNEPMAGEGSFRIETLGGGAPDTGAVPPPPRARGLAGLWERIVRFFFRRVRGPAVVRAPQTAAPSTRMTFWLRVTPGGPMAPMIDALMKPAMAAAAEDLAQRIVAHLEAGAAKS
ncbi:MAG TPA: SRPBCC family protein [Myxococcota bacterium]|nr:SRPBCC family protein [Myxococcota bacterium]